MAVTKVKAVKERAADMPRVPVYYPVKELAEFKVVLAQINTRPGKKYTHAHLLYVLGALWLKDKTLQARADSIIRPEVRRTLSQKAMSTPGMRP